MPITKDKKREIIKELGEKITKQKIVVFADFTGVKVKELSDLRKKIKKEEGELKVVKKTLARIAFQKSGLEIDTKKLQGEIAFILGYKDQLGTAKILYQFSKSNPSFKILGGFLDGELKGSDNIIALAQLPTREELLSMLVGSIASPMSSFINVLQGNIKGLIQVLKQVKT
ncbi:MAG: 50S ribosomal protein L10 [Candidatus Wildermuthbacteria bacterium RIFCSPLOWO2_12_FULL_40_9]|uniref:Large ribosomal subunit protein uL10 n=1 Tax=Candidatus Wildermuthbacteria bacterium RIFCSPLOWO2_12_FULL_40_9 TaxID=1802467 RepID=A0A1G2RXH2_9BACT|nr:MAG: 50S ribosomal protein L10 [Candidatus Wildermuthbacteria bacterium RIFCSPLOWO2_12_FULL_40_9]